MATKTKTTKAPKPAKGKAAKAPKGKATKAARKAKPEGNGEAPARKTRDNSKQAQFIAAMQTKEGISTTEAAERFGWQQHTVRGAIAGAIKKKLELDVTSEKVEGRGTVYRIAT